MQATACRDRVAGRTSSRCVIGPCCSNAHTAALPASACDRKRSIRGAGAMPAIRHMEQDRCARCSSRLRCGSAVSSRRRRPPPPNRTFCVPSTARQRQPTPVLAVCHRRTESNGEPLTSMSISEWVALSPEVTEHVGSHFRLPSPPRRAAARWRPPMRNERYVAGMDKFRPAGGRRPS